jgi:prepilin-type N-terminal cleavage/methylation domain-containing protein
MVQKLKNVKARAEGFTIIEVLIVLAIAGLILLIVFLAVPALQRNSRNTSYRNEASQILGAMSEFTNNNGGAVPTASVSTCGGTCDAKSILGLTKTRNINTLTIEINTGTTAPTFSSAVLRTGSRCTSPTAAGASTASRQVALLFAVEDSGGGVIVQCQESGS